MKILCQRNIEEKSQAELEECRIADFAVVELDTKIIRLREIAVLPIG